MSSTSVPGRDDPAQDDPVEDGVAERAPTPGSREFPELARPRFGLARFQAGVVGVVGLLCVVLGAVLLGVGETGLGALMLGIGAVSVALGWGMHRWMRRVERDPQRRNPQDNAFTRGLLRLRRDHPVLYGLLTAVMLVLLALVLWWRWTN